MSVENNNKNLNGLGGNTSGLNIEEGIDQEASEKVVCINRVSKVVKGGRRFSFNALAVVGDRINSVSIGLGKANEVPDAVRKSIDSARKRLRKVNVLKNGVLPHEVIGRFKSSKVLLMPATPGTGLIADEAVRSVLEQIGVRNVLTKVMGSKNNLNVVRATLDALLKLETPVQVARKRGIPLSQIFDSSRCFRNESKVKIVSDTPV